MKKRLSEEHRANIASGLRRIGWKGGMYGKKHKEETKRTMSEKASSRKRNPLTNRHKEILSNAHKGQIPWNKGKKTGKMSIEQRRKRIGLMMGEKNPAWKGGITSVNVLIRTSSEYKLWREAVFERDNWTYVWCKVRGGKLNADHIKPFAFFPELRFAIDNGRTLCVPCHKTTDTFASKSRIKYEKS